MWIQAINEETSFDVSDLAWTFFYPASGRDLNPLMRFSHLISRYVYVDYRGEDCFSFIEGHEPFPGLTVLRVGPKTDLPFYPGCLAFLSIPLRRRVQSGKPMWFRVVHFGRTVGGKVRNLRLVYINAEAHCAYASLYRANNTAPAFLCTICDGAATSGGGFTELALPDESFMRLVHQGRKPSFWIHDVAPFKRHPETKPMGWDSCLQGYSGWLSPTSGAYSTVLCRGDLHDVATVSEIEVFEKDGRRMVIEETRDIGPHLEGCDAVFVPTRFMESILDLKPTPAAWFCSHDKRDKPPHDFRLIWHLTPLTFYDNGVWKYETKATLSFSNLSEFLAVVADICSRHNYNRIAMVPFGYEDEGAAMLQWWQESPHLPQHIDVFVKHRLDLMDIRNSRV